MNAFYKQWITCKNHFIYGLIIFWFCTTLPLICFAQEDKWKPAFITTGCFLTSHDRSTSGKYKTAAYLPYGTVLIYNENDTTQIHNRTNYRVRAEIGFEGYLPKHDDFDTFFKDIPEGAHIISIDPENPLWVHRIRNNKTRRYTSFGMYNGHFLTIQSGPQLGWYYVKPSWIQDKHTRAVFEENKIIEKKAKIMVVRAADIINNNWVSIRKKNDFNISEEIIKKVGTTTIKRAEFESYMDLLKRCETQGNSSDELNYNFSNQEIGILQNLLNSKEKQSKITFDYYEMVNNKGGNGLKIIIAKLYQCDEENKLIKCYVTICNKDYQGYYFTSFSPDHKIPSRPPDVAIEYKSSIGRGYMGVIDGGKASDYFLNRIKLRIPASNLGLEGQEYKTFVNFMLYNTHTVFQPKN